MARIQPGLERIGRLLKDVEFPWRSIHVGGTNGKGSICHYASHLLARRQINVGSFTSPHVCDRWDGITIKNTPVSELLFRKIEAHYVQLNAREQIEASPFEILTATAFHIFNEMNVKVAVVEVGMGGKLDATNILNNQAVSVISSIARDHVEYLGGTLEAIAEHKAGILRPNTPYIVNPVNEWNIQEVIDRYAKEIGAGPRIELDSVELRENLYSRKTWHRFVGKLLPYQRDNAVLALRAAQVAVKSVTGDELSSTRAGEMMYLDHRRTHRGRAEWLAVRPIFGTERHEGRRILVDGAHNPHAAKALRELVKEQAMFKQTISGEQPSRGGWPTTWVLAMTEGKDAHEYLATLLQPGDNVVTTSFGPVDGMPWVKPMDPKKLLDIAKLVEPRITGLHVPQGGPLQALYIARYFAMVTQPVVLTGSLYLVGDLHREMRRRQDAKWWTDPQQTEDRAYFQAMGMEARRRVYTVLSETGRERSDESILDIDNKKEIGRWYEEEKRIKMQDELAALDNELLRLDAEQQRILDGRSLQREAPLKVSVVSSSSLSGSPAAESVSTGIGGEDVMEQASNGFKIVENEQQNHPIRKTFYSDPKVRISKHERQGLPIQKSLNSDPQLKIIKHARWGLPIRKFRGFDPQDKSLKRSFGPIGD